MLVIGHPTVTVKCRTAIKAPLVVDTGVKPIIHQSELRTYTKVVLFKENSSFRFAVL